MKFSQKCAIISLSAFRADKSFRNVVRKVISVNDVVLYGFDGVCQVTNVATKTIMGVPEECYVLQPVDQKSTTIFVPVANKALV